MARPREPSFLWPAQRKMTPTASARVIDAWPTLPEAIGRGILALVGAGR
jgi:hypothetical protein